MENNYNNQIQPTVGGENQYQLDSNGINPPITQVEEHKDTKRKIKLF